MIRSHPAGTSSILAGALLAAVYRCTGRTYTADSLIHAVLHLEQILTTGNPLVKSPNIQLRQIRLLIGQFFFRWRLAGSGGRSGGRGEGGSFQSFFAPTGGGGTSQSSRRLPGFVGAAPPAGVHRKNPPGSQPAPGPSFCPPHALSSHVLTGLKSKKMTDVSFYIKHLGVLIICKSSIVLLIGLHPSKCLSLWHRL